MHTGHKASRGGHRILGQLAIVVAAAVALAGLGPRSRACGQGAWGIVPDPITSAELARYMDRLEASEPQRQAAAAMHQQYKDDFKRLREGEVEKLMEQMRGLNSGGMGRMPQRKQLKDFIDAREQILTKVEGLDNALLVGLQPLLSDEQLQSLPRVRMARERARNSVGQMMPMMGQSVDLSAMIAEMDVSAPQRAAIDPILHGYEVKLTKGVREMSGGMSKLWLDMLDAMEAAGVSGDQSDYADPEKAKAMMETMQTVMAQVMKKWMEQAAEMASMNRQAYRSLRATLDADTGRALRDRFFQRAYAETFHGGSPGGADFARALKLKDLSDEQRQSIEAARAGHDAAIERIFEEGADLADEFRKSATMMAFGGGEGHQQYQEKIAALRVRRTELDTNAAASLRGILGDELARQLAQKPKEAEGEVTTLPDGSQAKVRRGDDAEVALENPDGTTTKVKARDMEGPDLFVPGPITEVHLRSMTRRLGLTDADQSILRQMLADYRAQYQALRPKEFKAIHDTQRGMWGGDGGQGAVDPDAPDRMHAARVAAYAAVERLDDDFFADVQATLLGTDAQARALARVRQARQREGYLRGAAGGMTRFGAGGQAALDAIDLAALLDQQRLEGDALAAAEPILAAYEPDLTRALKTRFHAALEQQRMDERFSLAFREADAGERVAMSVKMRNDRREVDQRRADAARVVADLNRSAFDQLLAALPASEASTLRLEFNKVAYPRVYTDPKSAEPRVNAAMKLPDLSPDQTSQLEAVAREFRQAYDELSEQMVAMSDVGSRDFSTFEAGDWQEFQKRQSSMARMRFDRNEASAAAIRKLRAILSPEQITTLGGLQEPGKSDQPNPYEFFE